MKYVTKRPEDDGPPEGGYEEWEPFDVVDKDGSGLYSDCETYIYWRRRVQIVAPVIGKEET